MAGLYSGDPAFLYVSAVRKGINEWRFQARKLISSEVDSISPDSQSLPVLRKTLQEVLHVQDFSQKLLWFGCS